MTLGLKEAALLFLTLVGLGFGAWFYVHLTQAPQAQTDFDTNTPAQSATCIVFKYYTPTGQPYQSIKATHWLAYPYAQTEQSERFIQPEITFFPQHDRAFSWRNSR